MRHHYDEAHHLFLEVASLACRDAGLDPFAMPGGIRTGVYLGHTGGSSRMGDMVYATGIDQTAPIFSDLPEAVNVLGVEANSVADDVTRQVRDRYPGRQPNETLDTQALGGAKIVHEALRLEGPYLVVDAACASSLQALAIGARSLLAGGVDQAIVGGASYCKSDSLVLFSAAQSVSNKGSYPFGQEADGLITAEGYVALVIKTLSRAVADGDRVRAVTRGLPKCHKTAELLPYSPDKARLFSVASNAITSCFSLSFSLCFSSCCITTPSDCSCLITSCSCCSCC